MEAQYSPEEINLKKYLQVLQRRWLVAAGVLVSSVGAAAFAASLQPSVYTASGDLRFRTSRPSDLTGIGERVGQLDSINTQSGPLSTEAVIVTSTPVVEEALAPLKLKDKLGQPLSVGEVAAGLKVENVTGTDILKVTYKSPDAKKASLIVNSVMDAYRQFNQESNRGEAIAAEDFIRGQLPTSQKAVDNAAEDLRKFKATNGIISLDQEATAIVGLMSKIDEDINGAEASLAESTSRVGELRRKVGLTSDQAIAFNSLNRSPGVQDALKELQTVQQQLSTVRTVYQDGTEQVSVLQRKQEALQKLLQERVNQVAGSTKVNVANTTGLQVGALKEDLMSSLVKAEVDRLALTKRISGLEQVRSAYRRQASQVPRLEKRQKELERRLAASQGTYETLLQRFQEVSVAKNQKTSNAEIIQRADMPTVADMKLRNLMLGGGAFMGLSLGIAAAFLVDLIDRSVKSVSEAKALFGYTLIGLIPKYQALEAGQGGADSLEGVSPRIMLANSPRSPVQESYQMLRANLKFISSDKTIQSMVITSSVPGEGKSEVSANLAAAIAQVGRRVLLVDADMRNPSQHHLWGLVNGVGLSNVIVGQEPLDRAVQTVTSRLSVLTAGVIPPNPLALIDSERMANLIAQMAEQYDYILFDTPPLAGIADAAVLGKMVDGVLLVVQPGVVNSASAAAARSLLLRSEPNVLGLVANGVNMRQEPDSYFYYNNDQSYRDLETVSKPRSWPMAIGRKR
jgi:polysaccharide biosynthesis transport protein